VRLLLDINVLLDLAFQRRGEPASAALIAQCGASHQAFVAWHTVATLAYLIERQGTSAMARGFIRDLLGWADIAPTTRSDAMAALALSMADLEDALQAAAAAACGAAWIVTRNLRDFVQSPVAALTPEDFLGRFPPP